MSEHAGERTAFDRVVLAAITTNLVVVAWGFADHSHAEALDRIDGVILWFFVFELAVRIWRSRMGFLRNRWNVIDALIILVSLLPVAGAGITLLRTVRVAKSFHLLRHTSHLRVFRWFIRWNNNERSKAEFRIVNGRPQPQCFYCGEAVALRKARMNRCGWVYGPCCGNKLVEWVKLVQE